MVLLASLLAIGSACAEGPARGFERFYEALGSPAALDHMSAGARAALSPNARAALVTTPPRMSLRGVRVVEERADTAVLEVEDTLGAKERVTMVREDGVWRVNP